MSRFLWAAALGFALFPIGAYADAEPLTLRLAPVPDASVQNNETRLARRLAAENMAQMRYAVSQQPSPAIPPKTQQLAAANMLFFKVMTIGRTPQGIGVRAGYLAQFGDETFACGEVQWRGDRTLGDQFLHNRQVFAPSELRSSTAVGRLRKAGCLDR